MLVRDMKELIFYFLILLTVFPNELKLKCTAVFQNVLKLKFAEQESLAVLLGWMGCHNKDHGVSGT